MNIAQLAGVPFPLSNSGGASALLTYNNRGGFVRSHAGGMVGIKTPKLGPIYPSVFAAPPTITNSASATLTPNFPCALLGHACTALTTAGGNIGDTTLTLAATDVTRANIGDPIDGRLHQGAQPGYGTAVRILPEGTTITAKPSSTTITVSAGLLVAISTSQRVSYGPTVWKNISIGPSLYVTNNTIHWMIGQSNGSWGHYNHCMEFDHYGSSFEISWLAQTTSPLFWIWVDGQPITADMAAPAGITPAMGTRYWTKCVFNHASDNVARTRRIRIYMTAANPAVVGVYVNPSDTISAVPTVYPKIACYGDSYFDGTTSAGTIAQNIAWKLSHMLGGCPPYNCAQGGTGYGNNGGGGNKSVFGSANRISKYAELNPDITVVLGSVNDSAVSVSDASAFYQSLLAACPNTRLFVFGPQSRGTARDTSTHRSNDTNQRTAAHALGIPYFSPFSEGWLRGTGNSGGATADGNADVMLYSDDIHPTQAGADMYARMMAAKIAEYF